MRAQSKAYLLMLKVDHIRIHNISLVTSVSESPWTSIDSATSVSQPISISLDICQDIGAAGFTDDLSQSVDYSAACKSAQKACNVVSTDFTVPTAYGLAERVLQQCLSDINLPISDIGVEIQLTKALLRAKSASVSVSRKKDGSPSKSPLFKVNDLVVHTIVGINPQERIDKQPVVITIAFERAFHPDRSYKFNFARLERQISDFVEDTAFLTVEALTSEIARMCFSVIEDPAQYTITVSVAKPAALRFADAPEISITRRASDYPGVIPSSSAAQPSKTYAAIALGANLGDRFQNIELALRYLDDCASLYPKGDHTSGDISVLSTSFLYETTPMYVEDQPSFINCACLVETSLEARELLGVCKQVESAIGRVPSVRFGPRAVDLDIIVYGEQTIDTRIQSERGQLENLEGHLVVPHPRMSEREFVLRPLNDIIPEWVHPGLGLPIRSLLSLVMLKKSLDEPPMYKVVPFPHPISIQDPSSLGAPATMAYWTMPDRGYPLPSNIDGPIPPFIMATLNVTPDSFSDGSDHFKMEDALTYVRQSVSAGAQIIDIGGYSTRPGAAFVSEDEEINRVVPIIVAIRNDSQSQNVLMSIDTFRVGVARAAINAGANCINDVYAFSGPDYPPTAVSSSHFKEMRELAREMSVPVIMMHSRGEAGLNKDYSEYKSPSGSTSQAVLDGVRIELGQKIVEAVEGEGGLRRWQVIVDPGIGFSKTVEDNLELLRNASEVTKENVWPTAGNRNFYSAMRRLPFASQTRNVLAGYPLLIGTSRKSFLGTIISKNSNAPSRPAKERDYATAAAITCAVQQGAAILRVHNVQGMVDVVKTAAALWL